MCVCDIYIYIHIYIYVSSVLCLLCVRVLNSIVECLYQEMVDR